MDNEKLRVRSVDPIPEQEYIQQFLEILQKRFLESQEYKLAFKWSIIQLCKTVFPKIFRKRNLVALLLILIPENGQSNATLVTWRISSG